MNADSGKKPDSSLKLAVISTVLILLVFGGIMAGFYVYRRWPVKKQPTRQNGLFENFNDGNANDGNPADWDEVSGDWKVVNGKYHIKVSAGESTAKSLIGSDSWTDYTFEVDVMGVGGTDRCILFRHLPDRSYRLTYWYRYRGGVMLIEKGVPGRYSRSQYAPFPNTNGTWVRLKVVASGANIKCYADGVLKIDWTDTKDPILSGNVGLTGWTGGGQNNECYFDNVRVTLADR